MFTIENIVMIFLQIETNLADSRRMRFNIPKRRYVHRPLSKNKTKVVSYRLPKAFIARIREASEELGWNLSTTGILVTEQFLINIDSFKRPREVDFKGEGLISFRLDETLLKAVEAECESKDLSPVAFVYLAFTEFFKSSH